MKIVHVAVLLLALVALAHAVHNDKDKHKHKGSLEPKSDDSSSHKKHKHIDLVLYLRCCIEKDFGDDAECLSMCDSIPAGVAAAMKKADAKEGVPMNAKDHKRGEHKGMVAHVRAIFKSESPVVADAVTENPDQDAIDATIDNAADTLAEDLKKEEEEVEDGKTASVFMELANQVGNPGRHTDLRPKGVMYYKWDTSLVVTPTDLAAVPLSADTTKKIDFRTNYANAMGDWSEDTCLVFEEDDTKASAVSLKMTGGGSACDDVGNKCTEINLNEDDSNLNSARHEVGHCIGLHHTNIRSNAKFFVKYHANACLADFETNYCTPGGAEFNVDEWDDFKDICEDVSNVDDIKEMLSKKVYGAKVDKKSYDHTKASDVKKCQTGICLKGWIYQYEAPTPKKSYVDAPKLPSAYDYGSIMHYPFDACLTAKKTKIWKKWIKKAPVSTPKESKPAGNNGVSEFDKVGIRELYGCKKISVTFPGKFVVPTTKEVYIHPDWTVADAKKYIAQKVGQMTPFTGTVTHGKKALSVDTKTLKELRVRMKDTLTFT